MNNPGPQFLSQRKCGIPDGPSHTERDAMPHLILSVTLIHSASSDHLFQVSLQLDLKATLGWKGVSPTGLPTHPAKAYLRQVSHCERFTFSVEMFSKRWGDTDNQLLLLKMFFLLFDPFLLSRT